MMADRWVTGAAGGRAGGPSIDISRFASEPQLKAFRRFVKDAADVATPLLATTAARLLESTASADDLLDRFVRGVSLAEVAGTLGCELEALAFFPRAFIQPVAEAALGRLRDQHAPEAASTRPTGVVSPVRVAAAAGVVGRRGRGAGAPTALMLVVWR